ncbi:MAG: hypothetical protein JXB06_15030, partial [Spirochaetales bacterium]|nr:hypothetical protein [Spirochaetales bacterium]
LDELGLEEGQPEEAEAVEELSLEEPADSESQEGVGEELEELSLEETPEEEIQEAVDLQPADFQSDSNGLSDELRSEIRSVLSYFDQLLEALPEEKIKEFAQSEYFVRYKRLFEELGLGA